MPKIVDNEQGVIVVNPNRGNSNGVDNPYTYPLTEDLCIAVNLYVQIPPKTGFAEGVVYEFEWNAGNGGSTVSLFKGRSFGPNDSYLTDYYTDITFDSSSKGESVEGLGIQSIDITYNADYIPQVSIKFVDVRGSSVFASANRSHENGNNDESMEGEFFRAFFTMPYPKFVLKVKGYYGRTASFLLSCVECNHTFDSATGNFIIDASFIGYTFAFFADIPFNILKCISLCEYANCNMLYGGSDFHFKEPDNSRPIPTFKDFISSLKTLSTSIEETKIEENSSSKQYRECQDKDTKLNKLNGAGSGLMESCHKFINSSEYFENVKTVEDNGVINKISFKIKGENIDKAKQTEILTEIGVRVQASLKSVGILIKDYGYENTIPYPTSRETGEIKTIKVSYVIGSKNEYVIDSSSFFKAIKKMMQSNAHEGNVAYNNASSELNQTAYTIMGFSPYIENVMRMIFANLQLFMHAMCTCVNNVSNRKLSDLDGIGDDKELSEAMSPNDLVGAFPSVYDKTGDMPKECWIGDIVKMKDGTDIEEVKFVKAIFQALKEEYKTEQAVAGDEASINFPHDVWYPLFIYDDPFTNYSENGASNPYKVISQNGSQNGDVVEEVFALIGLRIFKHMFFNESELEVEKLNNIIIEYEAKNIISGIKYFPTLDIIQSNPKNVFNSMVKKNIFGKQKTYGVSSVFYNIKDKSDYYMIPFFNVESSKYHIETDKSYDEYPRIIYDGKRPPLGLRIIDNKDIVEGYINYVRTELQGVKNDESIGCEIVEQKKYDELNSPISFFLKSSIYDLNKEFQKDKNIDIQKRLRIKALHFLAWCCNAGDYDKVWNTVGNMTWDSLQAFPSDHVLKPGTTHVMGLAHALYWGGAMWSSRHREEIEDYLPAPFFNFKDCGIDNTLVKYFMDWTSMEKVNGDYGDWVRLCNSSEIAYKDSRGIHPLDEQFWSSISGISDDMTQFKEEVDNWQSKNSGKTIVLSNGADYTSTYKDINMELLGNNKVELQDNTLSEQILRNIFDRSVIVVAGDVNTRYTSVYEGQTTSGSTYMSTGGVNGSYPEGRRIASKENFYSKLKDISSQSFYDKYAERLCNKIDELRKQSTEQSISPSSSNGGQSDNDVSDKDIYLSIYKCLQNINQKWAPRVEDKYSLSNFYEKSFSYRDKLFNDIGHKFMLNADKLLGLFVNNRSGGVSEIDFGIGSGYSLMEVLNNIFSYHNMLLVPTPNNINWLEDNKNVGKSLVDVFTPFSFDDISRDSVPQFIGIYVGMPSTSLNNRVGNGTMSFHKDDGLYLWGSKKTNVSINEGNTLPCFLISFSDQNNSMFKSISVGTKQNAITEQSLAAMYNLFEDSGKMTAKGQDLYSIYSQNSYQATIEMMGDANIQPLMYFQLNNANIFDGCYMIFKMEHHINENNDMTTRFTGMRMSNVYTPLVEDCVFVNSVLGENVFAGGGNNTVNITNSDEIQGDYFTIEKLSVTNQKRDNTPTDEAKKNLTALINNVLNPLHEAYGGDIVVNSGYRSPEVNKNTKGSSTTSQHMKGQAADITGGSNEKNKKLYDLIVSLELPYDQLIWEYGGRWVHVSHTPTPRRMTLSRPKNIPYPQFDKKKKK